MAKLVLLLSLYFYVIFAQDSATVDEYLDLINSFINSTSTYTYPTDSSSYLQSHPDETLGNDPEEVYDFVIVGAGSAGSVVARRLTDIPQLTVLLIEAGGEETPVSDIPGYQQFLPMSDLNWGYKSVPQKNSLLGFIDNVENVPRGKVLGGSSVLNAMMYARGNAIDYDRWAAAGNPGWAYKDVRPYFIKSEHANLTGIDREYHGFNGPLNVERTNKISAIAQAFIDANNELGRPTLDYNGKRQDGVSMLQVTEKNGQRFSANRAFLQPVKNRKNLRILTGALVTKLLFWDNIAQGVRYLHGGKCYRALANKEVILSAGSINTPQLLMLAGIGPADHLIDKHIAVLKHLPGVGQNLWNHLALYHFPFTINYTEPAYTQRELVEMYLNGTGPLTTANKGQDVDFVHLFYNDTSPDVEHILTTGVTPNNSYAIYQKMLNVQEETYNAVFNPLIGLSTWRCNSVLLHPKSRGSIRLKSKSPLDYPLIDPNYLSDGNQTDMKILVKAIKDMIKISNTEAMQKYNSQMFEIQLSSCPHVFGTDEYFECLIRHLANTIHHWSGTCKMGPKEDEMAVVGDRLLVHGLARLRIVDCSVIPVTIAGHTNAAAYMIAEKAADMIKQDYGL